MNNQSDIKRRIESVKQTRQITGAMETVSIAKMRKASELCERNRAYFDILRNVMKDVVAHGDENVREYLAPPVSGKPLNIVISSDKGLCGAFNHDIFKLADTVMTDGSATLVIGNTALDRYKNRADVISDHVGVSGNFDYAKAREIAYGILARYGSEFSSVSIIYTHLQKPSVWAPRIFRMLPFEPNDGSPDKAAASNKTEFEPSASVVLEKLVPLYVGGTIYGALVHSSAAEHSARRAAMSAATENADTLIGELSIEYNRARQSAVTSQITEIIGSTQAISQGDRK